MFTALRYTLSRLRGQIIGWGLSIAVLGLTIVGFYSVFAERQADFMQMVESYPPEILAFFGGDAASLMTPGGFLGMYGFSMLPLIAGIYAVLVGASLIAADEENGRLDLILSYPISRTGLFVGRVLAFVGASVAIMLIGWLGFSALLGNSSLDVSWGEMALPFLSLLAQVLVFGSLALLLSMILPAYRMAAMGAGVVLVVSYFLSSMSGLDDRLATVAQFLPYDYYQGGDAIGGLNGTWLLGLLVVSVVLVLPSWLIFQRRDIRVAGEGSWRLPRLLTFGRKRGEQGT